MQVNKWPVTFSIGMVTFKNPPDTLDEVITKADTVMYYAKKMVRTKLCKPGKRLWDN